jgi:hypothetical protein
MIETQCYSNTLRSAMAKLEQENSALLAEAEERESELSLLREAVMHCYGVVTVPNAPLREGLVARARAAIERLFPGPEELSVETISEPPCMCQKRFDRTYPPNCS